MRSRIIYVDPTKLKQHPEAAKLPQLPEQELAALIEAIKLRGYDSAYPCKLASDGMTILDGKARVAGAIAAKIKEIPAIKCEEGDDEIISILAGYILRRHLTDDQRAVLALQYQERLAALRNKQKGEKSARARKTDLSETDKSNVQKTAENSRIEAAKKFRVPENKLKTLAAIAKYEAENKVTAKDSLIPKVLSGELELSKAGEPAAAAKKLAEAQKKEAEEDAKREADKKARADREARIKALPDLPAIQEGAGEIVLRRQFKGDQNPPIDLLVLDSSDSREVSALIKAARPVLSKTFGIFVLCDFDSEQDIVTVMRAEEVPPIRLIWAFGDNEERRPNGEKHMSLLWSGTKQLAYRRGGDLIHIGKYREERPPQLWAELLKLAATSGDFVFFPCAKDATPAIQSELAKCTPITAIAENYLDAREKYDLQVKPDKWFELHSNFPKPEPKSETDGTSEATERQEYSATAI